MAVDGVAPSARTTVRRGAPRAVYDPAEIRAVLEAGLVAHVGVTTPDGPIVVPMAYGLLDEEPAADGTSGRTWLVLHGAVANAALGAGAGVDVCVTVTILDGLVVARTPLHNSMNHRSVIVRGTATRVEGDDAKRRALRAVNDHVAAIWDVARPPTDADVRRTMVVTVPLDEASAKIRAGDPVDEERDLDDGRWAGVVPLVTTWGEPTPAADLRAPAAVPGPLVELSGGDAHPR